MAHPARDPKKMLQLTAKNFEALFMGEMMSHMFEGIETDGPFGGGRGEEVFRSLMIEQYGKNIAESGQTGIANVLQKEMLRLQEIQSNPHASTGVTHVNA